MSAFVMNVLLCNFSLLALFQSFTKSYSPLSTAANSVPISGKEDSSDEAETSVIKSKFNIDYTLGLKLSTLRMFTIDGVHAQCSKKRFQLNYDEDNDVCVSLIYSIYYAVLIHPFNSIWFCED